MWWRLPSELVDEILQYVTFDGYVALCQTSSEVRQLLDTRRRFEFIVDANFHYILEAYEWQISNSITRASFWTCLCKLRRFIRELEVIYPTNRQMTADEHEDLTQKRGAVMIQAVRKFASNPSYFLPLIIEFKAAMLDVRRSVRPFPGRSVTFSIGRVSWLRRLLQVQNFLHAVRFFRKADPEETRSVEKCYFEISRCFIQFPEMARYRALKLKVIRKHIRSHFPSTSNKLILRLVASLRHCLGEVIRRTLLILDMKHSRAGVGYNINRIYRGVGRESPQLYLAIVAKILDEEIFGRFTLEVDGVIMERHDVVVTPLFVRAGPLFILINFDAATYSFYEFGDLSRLPTSTISQSAAAIDVRSILQRSFDTDDNFVDLPDAYIDQDWANVPISVSMIKLRFLRTILVSVSEHKRVSITDFRPLLGKSDFHLFFYATAQLLEHCDIPAPPFHEHTRFAYEDPIADLGYSQGDIFYNASGIYFGAVLGHMERTANGDTFLVVLPFDNVETTLVLPSSLTPMVYASYGPSLYKYLSWLLATDGMTYAGMYLFPVMHASKEELRLGLTPFQN